MIRTSFEYQKTLIQIAQLEVALEVQPRDTGNSDLQAAARADDVALLTRLLREAEAFRSMEQGELRPLHNVSEIGEWLITLRFARRMTEIEFGELTGVSPQQVSNDERDGYSGINTRRAHRLLEALGVEYQLLPLLSESKPEERFVDVAIGPIHPLEQEPVETALDVPAQVAEILRSDKTLSLKQALDLSNTFDRLYSTYVAVVPPVQADPNE